MVGEKNDLNGFSRIAQVYVSVRLRILVRANRAEEKLHASLPFARICRQISEHPIFFECFLHEFCTEQAVRKSARVTHLNSLHRLENGDIEFPPA